MQTTQVHSVTGMLVIHSSVVGLPVCLDQQQPSTPTDHIIIILQISQSLLSVKASITNRQLASCLIYAPKWASAVN